MFFIGTTWNFWPSLFLTSSLSRTRNDICIQLSKHIYSSDSNLILCLNDFKAGCHFLCAQLSALWILYHDTSFRWLVASALAFWAQEGGRQCPWVVAYLKMPLLGLHTGPTSCTATPFSFRTLASLVHVVSYLMLQKVSLTLTLSLASSLGVCVGDHFFVLGVQ